MTNCIPSIWEVTEPTLSIVRLHGRNHETWNKKALTTSVERFYYEELAGKINSIAPASVHVVFNNNYEDQGQRNVRVLNELIGGNLVRTRPT